MFTGIVSGVGVVKQIEKQSADFLSIVIEAPSGFSEGLKSGASVSVSGICLTVVSCEGDDMRFDVMGETIARTTISEAVTNQKINLERSAAANAEVGGHIVSGHVDSAAEIIAIQKTETNCVMTFLFPAALMKFIFSKGFIALDGCSLTVVNADYQANTCDVWFIPETLRATTFGTKKVHDKVNVEIDAQTRVIVETVERMSSAKE